MKEQIEEKNVEMESNFLIRAQEFVKKNQKMLTICGTAIVVIAAFFCLRAFVFTPNAQKAAAQDGFYAENYYMSGIDNNNAEELQKALDGDGKHAGFKKLIDKHSGSLLHSTPSIVNTYRYYAGVCALRLGKYDDAIKYLEDYSGKDYYTASIKLMAEADAYVEKGNNKKAIELYVKSAETNPNDMTAPAALFKAGMCCLMQNDNEGALKHFNVIKTQYPQSVEYPTIDYYIGIAEAK